jgi:transcriptional regulator with XRE-family HTH domain
MSVAAKLIREARQAAGLTQEELARRSRTSQSAVAAYESAAKVPSATTLDRLLRAAGSGSVRSHYPEEGAVLRPSGNCSAITVTRSSREPPSTALVTSASSARSHVARSAKGPM